MDHDRDIHRFRDLTVRPFRPEALNDIRLKIFAHTHKITSGRFPVRLRAADAHVPTNREIVDSILGKLFFVDSVRHVGYRKTDPTCRIPVHDGFHPSGQSRVFFVVLKGTALRDPQDFYGALFVFCLLFFRHGTLPSFRFQIHPATAFMIYRKSDSFGGAINRFRFLIK